MNWRSWLDTHRHTGPTAAPRPIIGYVRLHADCGRAEFDTANRLTAVPCPALLCGWSRWRTFVR